MANLVITNTFTAGTTIASAQVNQNYTDVKTWLNNRDNATDYWLNMKVSGTASNPAEIKSSAADCEFDIDSTGTNGTPRISWRRSGITYFTVGVDGAASNLLKFGTNALTTNVSFQIPTVGAQIQVNAGTLALPGMSFINGSASGFYLTGSSPTESLNCSARGINIWTSNSAVVQFAVNITPSSDNTLTCGANGARWSAVWAANGTIQTSHTTTKTKIETIAPDEVIVPDTIKFLRPGDTHDSKQIGFAADSLPPECFAVIDEQGNRSQTDVYLSAVVGILCQASKNLDKRISTLEKK